MLLLLTLLVPLILQVKMFTMLESCEKAKECGLCANSTDIHRVECEWCIADKKCKSFLLNDCPLEDRIPHPYNCPITVSNETYDEDFARHVVLPLIGGTNAKKKRLHRLLSKCFRKVRLVNSYEVSCDERTDLSHCYAYIAYLPTHAALAISFRGTSNLFQLLDEVISLYLYNKVPFVPTGGNIDRYYKNAFYKLWESGMKRDFERELKLKPNVQIWCLGHSLGGGLASIAAAHISFTYDKREEVKLATFGQPRIGDIAFAIGHDKLVPNSVRIIHRLDPIPALPPRSFETGKIDLPGAFHHKFEIWYPFGMQPGSYYQIGRNADEFSRSASMDRWMDHLNYFEVQLDKFPQIGCHSRGGVNYPFR